MTVGYRVGASLMAVVTRALARWQVINKEAVPREGPVIVAANHISLIDPPLLMASIPRPIVFMAKEEAFQSLFGEAFFWVMGVMPVRRGQPDRGALVAARRILESGGALGIFPEGTRSRNGQLGLGYQGCALLALWTGAPILPVGITGTEAIKGLSSFPSVLMGSIPGSNRLQLTVNIGEPFPIARGDGPISREHRVASTRLIMEHIAQLLPPEYRGIYGDEEKVSEGAAKAATFG